MPRKKIVVRDQQIYKLPLYGATVTIDYDVENPPPFFQPSSGVVIVGEHECEIRPGLIGDFAGRQARVIANEPRGGNLIPIDSDEFARRKANLQNSGKAPAPAGESPRPYTSEDAMNEMFGTKLEPGQLDVNVLAAAAGASIATEE